MDPNSIMQMMMLLQALSGQGQQAGGQSPQGSSAPRGQALPSTFQQPLFQQGPSQTQAQQNPIANMDLTALLRKLLGQS